jgi:hypothetical protein
MAKFSKREVHTLRTTNREASQGLRSKELLRPKTHTLRRTLSEKKMMNEIL